jgi:hypothetical protein
MMAPATLPAFAPYYASNVPNQRFLFSMAYEAGYESCATFCISTSQRFSLFGASTASKEALTDPPGAVICSPE